MWGSMGGPTMRLFSKSIAYAPQGYQAQPLSKRASLV